MASQSHSTFSHRVAEHPNRQPPAGLDSRGRLLSHLGVKGSSRGAARGGAGGLPVGGGFSGSSNNLESGQEASAVAGLRLPDLPGVNRRGEVELARGPHPPFHVTPSIAPAHLGSWLPRDTEGTLLFVPASSLSMLIHSGRKGKRKGRLRGPGIPDPRETHRACQPLPSYSSGQTRSQPLL